MRKRDVVRAVRTFVRVVAGLKREVAEIERVMRLVLR